jgi:Asp-tRNA(Asn)/Glu-tRNA(Gln) amidotransferase A subunit family amidase
LLRTFLAWLESGEKTPRELIDLCLRRIADNDADLRAWAAVLDTAPPDLQEASRLSVPFGAKDIFETTDFPTAYGSPIYAGRRGNCDAALIQQLRRAGAVLVGKTHTTAFASFDPAPTRNPRAPGHTPGGSSAGSAAAVAAGMVPFAIGTQTLGSILRPASYCGICGFKPTFGLLPTDGILAFAPSLDTAGLFTETATDMACLWERAFDGQPRSLPHRVALWSVAADEPMLASVSAAAARFRARGFAVDEFEPIAGWDRLLDSARTINHYEGARSHAARYAEFGERIGAQLAALVRTGLALPADEYQAALAHVEEMRASMDRVFEEHPMILTPATIGPAPLGFATTGDPRLNAPWTALGVPAISIPMPTTGAPLGLQITAARGCDDALLSFAATAEKW